MHRRLALHGTYATTRRCLIILAAFLIGATTLLSATPAAAEVTWCWADPVISLNGQRVAILTGVAGTPEVVDKQVQAAITTVSIPRGVQAEKVSYINGVFKDKKVDFVHTDTTWQPGQPIPVTVVVTFKAKASLPAQVLVDYPGGHAQAQGTTLGETRLSFTLPAR